MDRWTAYSQKSDELIACHNRLLRTACYYDDPKSYQTWLFAHYQRAEADLSRMSVAQLQAVDVEELIA